MPGFKDTADFFAKHARKERDPTRRAEHIRTEAFYRSLAKITPTFPPKYSAPQLTANRYLDRAEECRTMAECFSDPTCRRQMMEVAMTYEKMAELRAGDVHASFTRPLEAGSRPPPSGSNIGQPVAPDSRATTPKTPVP
ncbi:MAG: hypothetical protein K2Y27_21875 [Xanthobacteraceae bacterium]|nr:hypothetical protein [Xanthobacteraceae bacterium]